MSEFRNNAAEIINRVCYGNEEAIVCRRSKKIVKIIAMNEEDEVPKEKEAVKVTETVKTKIIETQTSEKTKKQPVQAEENTGSWNPLL